MMKKNFFLKYIGKKFSTSLNKEFNLSKKDFKDLNNLIKEPWVKHGKDKIVGAWFFLMAGVVMGMVALGGYVRLEKAGLSMVRWDLGRIKLPRSDEEWKIQFEEYKDHPQYSNDFPEMNIEDYKYIYKLEHYHRQLGKLLGLIFIIPFATFLKLGYLKKKIIITSLLAFSLGATQGIIGWWMVKSGLKNFLGDDYKKQKVKVSQYRLAFHFTMSVFIYSVLLKTGLFLVSKPQILNTGFDFLLTNGIVRRKLVVSFHLALATLIWGAFMAGTDAGKICNTFPKMGDVWIPYKEHFYLNPLYRNFFENEFIIHFTHRTLACTTFLVLFYQLIKLTKSNGIYNWAYRGFFLVFLITCTQANLGISSVWNSVPVSTAHKHQFFGLLTMASFVLALHTARRVNSNQIKYYLSKLNEKNSSLLKTHLNKLETENPELYKKFFKKEYESMVNIKI